MNLKTKFAVSVVAVCGFAVLLGWVLFVWASPGIVARAPTLPAGQALQPQFLPGYLAMPLLIFLGAALLILSFRKKREDTQQ